MATRNEFPSSGEWHAIFIDTPFPSLLELARLPSSAKTSLSDGDIRAFAAGVATGRLDVELYNRVLDVARSYVFMKYYHSQGIPDERWFISPGRSGQSVEYFPDFEEPDFITKQWFDYYAETFYLKLFSAWAIVGHILNETFNLGLKAKQVDFEPAVKALAPAAGEVKAVCRSVLEDAAFVEARVLRNNITHNESPSAVGMTVSRSETAKAVVYSLGMKPYATSTAMVANATAAVALLRLTIETIRTKTT